MCICISSCKSPDLRHRENSQAQAVGCTNNGLLQKGQAYLVGWQPTPRT